MYAWFLLTYIVINTILGRLTLDPSGMHCPSWDNAFVSSLEYVSACNAAKIWDTQSSFRDYEKVIAKCAKTNPKAFYRYANSKAKSQTRFPDMKCDDGTEVTGNKDKAELFNKIIFFVACIQLKKK